MALETLEILIEADRTGLESQLKRAGESIVRFVGEMNKQEVNWTSILSRTIQPAIITGIASLFAMSIASFLQYQLSMIKAAAGSQRAFEEAEGPITEAVLDISSSTGVAATDVAEATGRMIQLFGDDLPTAMAAVDAAAKLAVIRHMDLKDVIDLLIPIFDNWGITTVPGVTEAITVLDQAARTGKIGFSELAKAAAEGGVILRDKTNLQDVVFGLEAMSKQAGMTADGVLEAFSLIVKGVQEPASPLNALLGGLRSIEKSIDKEGVIGAFELMTKGIQKFGKDADIIFRDVGLGSGLIVQLGAQSESTFESARKGMADAIKEQKSLNEQFNRSLAFTDMLKMGWEKYKNTLIAVDYMFGELFKTAGTGIINMAKDLEKLGLKGYFEEAAEGLKELTVSPKEFAKNVWGGLKEVGSDIGGFFGKPEPVKAITPRSDVPSGNVSIENTFNMTVPKGGEAMTAKRITTEIYNEYQGIR